MRGPYTHDRLTSLLSRLAAEFIERESNGQSLITVTRVHLADNLKNAIIFFTVLPDDREEAVQAFLARERKYFKDFIRSHSRLGITPSVIFRLDEGEKNRQTLDTLE